MDILIAYAILAVPAALLMGIVRLLGVTNKWLLLLAAMIGGALAGAFIASAASAMASAVDPQVAMLRGGGIGLGIGLLVGGLILLLAMAISSRG